jgi:MFS family permease
MIRKILAFLLGGFAGGVFNMALVTVSSVMYPLPEGVDPNNFEAFRAHVEANGLATGALIIVLVAHAGGSFVSGFICGLIAMRPWYLAATILGILWTCGGVAMLMMLPAPTWFAVADILLYVPAALLGVNLGGALTGRRSLPVATQ